VSRQSQVAGGSRVGGRELPFVSREPLISAVRAGTWSGLASQLSEDHVQWTFIDEIAAATRDPGHAALSSSDAGDVPAVVAPRRRRDIDRPLILQRRSALAFDGVSSIAAGDFFEILARAMPSAAPPWDALWWDARIHL